MRILFGRNSNKAREMKIPKIICTLGTTTDDPFVLRQMIESGMAMARINTAYATIARYKQRIDLLRSIAEVPVILDLKGSQIRIFTGDRYRIGVGDEFPAGFKNGDIAFNHDFFEEVLPGDEILFENGTIRTIVAEKKNHYLVLKVIESGEGHLTNHMGANIPGRVFKSIPSLTEKDREVVEFAVKEKVEFLAVSFVRTSEDVSSLREMINEKKGDHKPPEIIVKIEDPIGAANLETIIKELKDSEPELTVMIGRGDLFVEAPKNQLPFLQKKIIKVCGDFHIPVIAATGFLESMQYGPYPTRAEVCDVVNVILDGADFLMLSGETSNSQYPAEAVKTLQGIIGEYKKYFRI